VFRDGAIPEKRGITVKSTFRLSAIALGVVLAATACGTAQEPIQPSGQQTSAASTSQPPTTQESQPPPAETTTPETSTYTFGQTATFEDGMRVTIGRPVPFKPSEYAAGTEHFTKFVKFTITIENHSGKPFDPTMATMTVLSGETQCSEVFDMDHSLGGSPNTKLLNGRKVSYTVGFGVKDPKDLVAEYSLSWDRDAVMYSNTTD
jgi:hypothetical protein